ncbi:MAG TPA: hypothetical protein V6D22_18295 [Candidatus Obscuribacterales bacterium]
MRIQIPAVGAAVIFTVLGMGALGILVLLPIACIQWTWNSVMSSVGVLPLINAWQSSLLYLALATLVYLSGIVRIEFETENLD